MKYYVYMSDTKVDMLYAQIPQSIKKRIATEIRIDLKILSTTFKDKEKGDEETRYSKLAMVVDYIEKHLDIGTIDRPKSYFRGVMNVDWGILATSEEREIAYFGGKHNNNSIMLGGSVHHFLGHTNKNDSIMNSSRTYELVRAVEEFMDNINTENILLASLLDNDFSKNYKYKSSLIYNLYRLINYIQHHGGDERINLARGKIEFLAKVLIQDNQTDKSEELVILASPIYVALAD